MVPNINKKAPITAAVMVSIKHTDIPWFDHDGLRDSFFGQ